MLVEQDGVDQLGSAWGEANTRSLLVRFKSGTTRRIICLCGRLLPFKIYSFFYKSLLQYSLIYFWFGLLPFTSSLSVRVAPLWSLSSPHSIICCYLSSHPCSHRCCDAELEMCLCGIGVGMVKVERKVRRRTFHRRLRKACQLYLETPLL